MSCRHDKFGRKFYSLIFRFGQSENYDVPISEACGNNSKAHLFSALVGFRREIRLVEIKTHSFAIGSCPLVGIEGHFPSSRT
jgi:hypothetical protein